MTSFLSYFSQKGFRQFCEIKEHSVRKVGNKSCSRLCLSMWEWPNLFSLVKSIFIGQIYFHWSNLFCGIYGVRPSATKIDFFPKNPSLKKGFVCQCGSGRIFFSLTKSIFIGQKGFVCHCGSGRIYFHWSNLKSENGVFRIESSFNSFLIKVKDSIHYFLCVAKSST